MKFITLNAELANRAHSGTSFDPEKRGAQHIKDFNEGLREDFETFKKLAVSPPQIEVLNSEFLTYQNSCKSKFEAYLSAKSRCISPMITGPANFPVRRNEKANKSVENRWNEYRTWEERAIKSIKNKIAAARTPEQLKADIEAKESASIEYLLQSSISVIDCIGGKTAYSPQLLKGGLERRIMNFAKNNPELAEKVVSEINLMCQEKYNKDVFTSKHKIWKAIEAIKEEKLNPPQAEETKELYKSDHLTIVNNFEESRVQLLFDDKPGVEVRNKLKSYGFRWSPRFTAWQRQNTSNGLYNAKLFLKEFACLNKLTHMEQ